MAKSKSNRTKGQKLLDKLAKNLSEAIKSKQSVAPQNQERGYIIGPETVDSSWIVSIGYYYDHPGDDGLGIILEFGKGTFCFYGHSTYEDFVALQQSSSKGHWLHGQRFYSDYKIVNP